MFCWCLSSPPPLARRRRHIRPRPDPLPLHRRCPQKIAEWLLLVGNGWFCITRICTYLYIYIYTYRVYTSKPSSVGDLKGTLVICPKVPPSLPPWRLQCGEVSEPSGLDTSHPLASSWPWLQLYGHGYRLENW